ncbi:hypothetical protein LCGC14_0517800 [marine sediment metagenome]|uniref:Uncharacterized protein n=1 Tax=marine sediment metagenome TaxID=412755 RepID=A0A0F9V7M7_9ZZZZ|nr:hypothetical protein [bacterium]
MPSSANFTFTKGNLVLYGDLEEVDSSNTNIISGFTAGGGGEATDTFGYTTAGSTKYTLVKDKKQGSIFTLTQYGEIIKVSAYADLGGGAKDPKFAKAAIYSVSGGVPVTLLNVSEEVEITTTKRWYDFPFAPTFNLPDGEYWIGLIHATKVDIYGHTGAANQRAYNSDAYSDGPETTFISPTMDAVELSIYATYNYTTGSPESYDLDTEIEWKPNETISTMDDLSWSYVNSTAINFYVYNWGTSNYEDFTTSISPLALGGNYNSSDNRVKVKFNGTNTSEFTVDINQLQINYSTPILPSQSHWIRLTDFNLLIPTGARIDGIVVDIDRYASGSNSIKDDSIRLRNSTGQVGDDKAHATWWPTSDTYDSYGGISELWGKPTPWTASEINDASFGVDIAVKNDGVSNTASIDEVRITVYYTEALTQDTGIVRPDGDIIAQWESLGGSNHYDLINEVILDLNAHIYTSSIAASNIIDNFDMGYLDISSGVVTQIQIKLYGKEIDIDSEVNVYCGTWLGAEQLEMTTPGLYTYTWTGLSASQTNLTNMQVKFESAPPQVPTGLSLIGQFIAVEGTSNKFSYNWADIESTLNNYQTGQEVNITVSMIDIDSGYSLNISHLAIIDWEDPTSIITIGNGITDYSLNSFAAPWTTFAISGEDNLQGVINHTDYYYSEEITTEYQINIFDMANNSLYSSGFNLLLGTEFTLFDLGIPVVKFEDHTQYYYKVEFRITDAAGNSITNSSYLGDLYDYDEGSSRILVSNEVSIQFENNMINVNDLYQGIGNIINFTLIGADASELKNNTIRLKSGNYYLETTLWNETTQTYTVKFDSIDDLILYSENIFQNSLTANYDLDWKLNWDAMGLDYYAFAKHASQKDPLGLVYTLQEERTTIMDISERDGFRIPDYINYTEVYSYLYNSETNKYDVKHIFTQSDFLVHRDGLVTWNVNFSQYNIKSNIVIFEYYGSDFAHLINDNRKNGMFFKVLIPNIYSTHSTIDKLQIYFVDFEDNTFVYTMDTLDFDKYFKNASQYKRVIPGLSELLEIPIELSLVEYS